MGRRASILVVAASLLLSGVVEASADALPDNGPEVCAYYASQAGFTDDALVEAIAVGMTESHCDPDATHRNPNGQLDQGIFQIGTADGSQNACYLNPACNSQEAFRRYSNQQKTWLPAWQASYNTPRYRDWLDEARTAATPYLEPSIGRIGVLVNGALHVKEGTTQERWGTPQLTGGVAKFEIDGNRIGALTTTGDLWVKEGGLQAGWGNLQSGNVKDFHLAGNRIGILRNDSTLAVKEGGTDAGWDEQTSEVVDFDLTPERIGAVLSNGRALVKEGTLKAGWTNQLGDIKDIELAGNRIGLRRNDNSLVAKEGTLWETHWHELTPDVVDFELTQTRVGVVFSNGRSVVKDGALNASWGDTQLWSSVSIDLSGNRIGVLQTDGKYWVKEGTMWADWIGEQAFGVSQGDLTHRK